MMNLLALATTMIACLIGCGTDVKKERVPAPVTEEPPAPGISFAAVLPIIDKHCALAGCHAGAGFVSNGPAFKSSSSKAKIQADLMPLRSSPNYDSWGDDEKAKLLEYLDN